MKAQSFEHRLRNAVPPTPDAEARLRARNAALAEFRRIHARDEAPVAPAVQPASRKESRSPLNRGFWNAWVSGFATACLLLVGVSVVWLMPPRDREMRLNLPMKGPGTVAPAAPAAPAANEQAPPPAAMPPRANEPRESQPSLQVNEPRESPPSPQASERRDRPALPRGNAARAKAHDNAGTASPRSVTNANREQPAASPAGASADVPTGSATAAVPTTEAPLPAATGPAVGVTTTFDTAGTARTVTSGAATPSTASPQASSAAVTTPPPLGAASPSAQPTEVIVTGARIMKRSEQRSPTPVTTTEHSELEEITVTGAERPRLLSRLRSLFSRKEPDATQESPPSAAPAAGAAATAADSRDQFRHFDTNAVKRVADDPVSTFSVDVDTAAYSFVRRKLNEGVRPDADSVRVEEMINYFDYAWPAAESRDRPFKPTVTVSDSPWGEGKKLIHIGIKGYALPASQRPDVNLVLLLDVSGSMDSPDKLPLAKRSMALLLDSLKPTDTVGIVVYAGRAGQVLAPTPVSEKETILRALDLLTPGGSTAGAEGIRLAYALAEKTFRKGGVNRILLATDGDFNVGISDPDQLKRFVEREREKGVYLSVLGFGEGNYHDETAQALAQNGNGVAAYIDTLNEAKKVLVREATSSLFPIAKDVKLQVEFNPATVAEYRLVGYETRALNREDFNNDKVDAGDVGSGHTVTAIYEITPVGSKAQLIDDRRYADPATKSDSRLKTTEYGYLKIRYKLPNGFRSRLLEQPILVDAGVPAALRQDVEFSTAVAGFAQLLRGGQYTGKLGYEEVLEQARDSLGEDPYGYRAEFLQMVEKTQRAR